MHEICRAPRAHPTGPRPWMPTTPTTSFTPQPSPFSSFIWPASPGSGPGPRPRRWYFAVLSILYGCSPSGRATIATSPTAPTRPAGPFSSCSPSWRRPQPSVGCCGGRPSTAGTTATRIPSSTCTRRASMASSVLTSAGSSRRGMGPPTTMRSPISRDIRSWCGSIGSPTCRPPCSAC